MPGQTDKANHEDMQKGMRFLMIYAKRLHVGLAPEDSQKVPQFCRIVISKLKHAKQAAAG